MLVSARIRGGRSNWTDPRVGCVVSNRLIYKANGSTGK